MIHYDEENNYIDIFDLAIKNQLGTQNEIQLYQQLIIALELIDDDFKILYSEINHGIHFAIVTPYPNGLPESIGSLFFNIDLNFDVKIKEILDMFDDETHIKKPEYGIDLSHFSEYLQPDRFFLIKIIEN